MDKRFMTVLGMSVLLALLVSGIFYQITVRANSPRKQKYDTKDLVVATGDLPVGATVKPSDLHLVKWPADSYPKGGFSKIEDVVDRAVVSNVLAEEPLVAGRLSEKNAGVGLSSVIPAGMRAVSVAVNNVIGVAGFVLPGTRVDVLVTGTPAGRGDSTRMTTTVLQNILVISAGTKIQPDSRGQPENVPVVTMLVTPEQAEILTLASNEGRIQLVLRNPTDDKTQKPVGVHVAALYGNGLPDKPKAPAQPRTVQVKASVPLPPPAAAPPAPVKQVVEMIRGEKRAVETVGVEKPEKN
ncbi:MAG: Flp pilus assembly protein CpaB [Acidobacteria bacterium]|nr:Flp pilus assembly protein CpaB [Acidobacteriota bacterium]